ncbi:MAG: hypothetical protein WCP99_03805 [Burkholderiales bacterium]
MIKKLAEIRRDKKIPWPGLAGAFVCAHDPVAGINTIGVGLVLANQSDADEDVAIKIADERRYEAKRLGRNRVAAKGMTCT